MSEIGFFVWVQNFHSKNRILLYNLMGNRSSLELYDEIIEHHSTKNAIFHAVPKFIDLPSMSCYCEGFLKGGIYLHIFLHIFSP